MAMYRHFPPEDTGEKAQNKEINIYRIKTFNRTGRSRLGKAIRSWILGSKREGKQQTFK